MFLKKATKFEENLLKKFIPKHKNMGDFFFSFVSFSDNINFKGLKNKREVINIFKSLIILVLLLQIRLP